MSPCPSATPTRADAHRRARACAPPRRAAALLLTLGTLGALAAPVAAPLQTLQAQSSDPAPTSDRWTVSASWLQLGTAPLQRAPGSADLLIGWQPGSTRSPQSVSWRVDGGWMRAAHARSNAEGVTLALSAGLPIGRHWGGVAAAQPLPWLVVRPGVSLLGGRADAQGGEVAYDWRGLPGTSYAGQTGTAVTLESLRAPLFGAAATLAAELPLAHGIALTGSVRSWRFSAPILGPDRSTTLAGFGVAVQPRPAVAGMRWWWREWRDAGARSASHTSTPAPVRSASEVRP